MGKGKKKKKQKNQRKNYDPELEREKNRYQGNKKTDTAKKQARTHTCKEDATRICINPYTFIEPRGRGEAPVFGLEQPSHAWLDQSRHTGRLECSLKFLTPAVIPGETRKAVKGDNGSPSKEGVIHAHVSKDLKGVEYLTIPGGRIRGHILELMRIINASPLKKSQYDDRPIEMKRAESPKPGFIDFREGEKVIIPIASQQIDIRITNTNSYNSKVDRVLQCADFKATVYGTDKKAVNVPIPRYDPRTPLDAQGVECSLWVVEKGRNIPKTRLLAQPHEDKARILTGRWETVS